jgi:hypothetical protein
MKAVVKGGSMRRFTILLISVFLFAAVQAGSLQINGVKIQLSDETAIALYLPQGGFHLMDVVPGKISRDRFERIAQIGNISISYDTLGRVEKIGKNTITYDTLGRVGQIGSLEVIYDSFGRISRIGTAVVSYDMFGRINKIGETQISYDSFGRIDNVQGDTEFPLSILIHFN